VASDSHLEGRALILGVLQAGSTPNRGGTIYAAAPTFPHFHHVVTKFTAQRRNLGPT
jgi:hypothetical protein